MQAHEEPNSARVQATERAMIGQNFLQTIPSHSISLFLIQDKILWSTNLLLIAGSYPDEEDMN